MRGLITSRSGAVQSVTCFHSAVDASRFCTTPSQCRRQSLYLYAVQFNVPSGSGLKTLFLPVVEAVRPKVTPYLTVTAVFREWVIAYPEVQRPNFRG